MSVSQVPATMPRRMSPTAIDRYRACPKAAYYQYVAKVGGAEAPNPYFALGNAVHAALERFYGLEPAERSLEVLHRCLRTVWPKFRAGAFRSRDEEIDYGRQGLRILADYWEEFANDAVPVTRERWFSVRLENDVELYCKADRVDGPPIVGEGYLRRGKDGGALEVIDYKTSRRFDLAPEDLPDEPAAQTYALAVNEHYEQRGLEVGTVRYLFLADRGSEVRWTLEPDDLATAEAKLVEQTNRMLADSEFEANPGDHCSRCRFADLCPDAGRVELDELVVPEGMPF